jgi:hypothetical protein
VRRVEQGGDAFLRKPDDGLEFQRIQIAHAAAAEVL